MTTRSMAAGAQWAASALKKFGSVVYPKVCLNCNDVGQDEMDLCERCFQNLPWVEFACQRCALPLLNSNSSLCGACTNRELYFDYASAPFQFDGFIRDAIYQFKFNQKLNQGKLLAQLLLKHIEEKQLEIPELIIPVPLHKKRICQRGYNQALEIARIVSKHISSELDYDTVYRNRDTSVQMELPAKQRHKNVQGAFSVKENATVLKNKHICIVDDVMTTGNTVNEVAKCARNVGAKKIDVWCVARVA
ncbi:MAG: double zinc ribbon domain-containing protein [Gammaproteobacteria bacterium]